MANQAEERALAITKIRKLRNQTVGAGRTEGEASMAMTKMSELMEVYDITMDEVALGNIEFVQEHVAIGSTKTDFMVNVLVNIGEFCGVIVWTGREPGTDAQYTRNYKVRKMKAYFFFGAKEDVEMALYLFEVIQSAINHETDKYKRSLGKGHRRGYLRTATHGFRMGMISRINDQLEEKTEERTMKYESTGSDLVLAKDARVREELKKTGISLRTNHRRTHRGDASSRSAGSAAGEGINLSRPINSGPGGQRLLT